MEGPDHIHPLAAGEAVAGKDLNLFAKVRATGDRAAVESAAGTQECPPAPHQWLTAAPWAASPAGLPVPQRIAARKSV